MPQEQISELLSIIDELDKDLISSYELGDITHDELVGLIQHNSEQVCPLIEIIRRDHASGSLS